MSRSMRTTSPTWVLFLTGSYKVRVGMHTGPVVIGEGAAPGADVFGDTPNVAARVQALAEPDAVLITEATHRLV
jgi:class 3 adenylate cyclase